MQSLAIPIRVEPAGPAGAACGTCGQGSAALCSAALPVFGEPRLTGRSDSLQRILASLKPLIDAELGAAVETGAWLRGLRLDDGEAEVILSPSLACRGVAVAGIAFDALRRLLPDTDIYIGTAEH